MRNLLKVHRVFVTGLGVITPLGNSVEELWNNLIAGKSGIRALKELEERRRASLRDYRDSFDLSGNVQVAGFPDFDPLEHGIDRKTAGNSDLVALYALAAAFHAIRDAKLEEMVRKPESSRLETSLDSMGVLIGSGVGGQISNEGGYRTFLENGPERLSAFDLTRIMPNEASGAVSIRYGLGGPSFCAVSACASGNDAFINAYLRILIGDARLMLAGGSEAIITPRVVGSFDKIRAIASGYGGNPAAASRPFDMNRRGLVLSEGAAVIVLESEESVLERGVAPYAEMIGYGQTNDAYHITQPHPQGKGAARCMVNALKSAGIKPEDVDYVNAHGTGTKLNDAIETLAIKAAFGKHAYRLLVSSTKSMTGHMIGAAGAVEAAACILALHHGVIPPTINRETPDPECDLNYVPNVAVKAPIKVAMNNSFGFGGHNSVTVFRKCEK